MLGTHWHGASKSNYSNMVTFLLLCTPIHMHALLRQRMHTQRSIQPLSMHSTADQEAKRTVS